MLQIIGLVFVVAVVYAIKAVVIARSHVRLADLGSSFSWMHARPEDEVLAATWAVEEEPQRLEARVPVHALRPISGASA